MLHGVPSVPGQGILACTRHLQLWDVAFSLNGSWSAGKALPYFLPPASHALWMVLEVQHPWPGWTWSWNQLDISCCGETFLFSSLELSGHSGEVQKGRDGISRRSLQGSPTGTISGWVLRKWFCDQCVKKASGAGNCSLSVCDLSYSSRVPCRPWHPAPNLAPFYGLDADPVFCKCWVHEM